MAISLLCFLPGRLFAQGEGPRTYLHVPLGTTLLVPSYLSISSNFNPAQDILIEGADISAHVFPVTFVPTFSIGGRLAQLWITPIYASVDGTIDAAGSVTDIPRQTGFMDPTVVFRVGLSGAPALRLPEFAKHKQTFGVYALLGLSLPLGEYDRDNPVNLGTNRWTFRFGLPMVVPMGNPARPFLLEVVPSLMVYADNNEPQQGTVRSQDPLVLIENHLSHNLAPKFWLSLDLRGQYGGETATDGVPDDNQIRQLGGGVSGGYSVSRAIGLHASFGGIIAKKGPAEGTLLRFKLVWSF
jgi:hypothetical protein